MIKKIISVTFMLLLVCLYGCDNNRVVYSDSLETASKKEDVFPLKEVGIYIDVTSSMKGFLNNPYSEGDTLYSLCLHEMGKLIAVKYSEPAFYRVDTPLWRVHESGETLEDARNADYYSDSAGFSKEYEKIGESSGYDALCLTPALENGRDQSLSILITDFYENSTGKNTNADKLIAEIRKLSNLDDEKVFGLIGIKSVFAGTIYDVGPNGDSIKYGLDELAYRPFYVIVRGYPNHVREFCNSMIKRLESIGAQRGLDFESTLFCYQHFPTLDYTDFMYCANDTTRNSKLIQSGRSSVDIKDSNGQISNLPVYNYRKSTDIGEARTLYFAYAVGSVCQDKFHALAEKSGELVRVDFLQKEKDLYVLPSISQNMEIAYRSEKNTFEPENKEDSFVVQEIYYDKSDEMLYVALLLDDRQIDTKLLRLRWASALSQPDLSLEPWWESWNSPTGEDVDYGKTERLTDYVSPILEELSNSRGCILNGVAYLMVKDG